MFFFSPPSASAILHLLWCARMLKEEGPWPPTIVPAPKERETKSLFTALPFYVFFDTIGLRPVSHSRFTSSSPDGPPPTRSFLDYFGLSWKKIAKILLTNESYLRIISFDLVYNPPIGINFRNIFLFFTSVCKCDRISLR